MAKGPAADRERYKKLINDPLEVVDEALEGFVAAHGDLVRLAARRVVARPAPIPGKVGFVVGGGSGHEPAFAGYVGDGLADAAACGNVFASPPPDVVLDAIRAASGGAGVVMGYGNYAGDVLNFSMAAELAAAEGIEVREIRVSDDVASAPREERSRRRGIAGDVLVFKCIGAAAARGDDLDAVERDRPARQRRDAEPRDRPHRVRGAGLGRRDVRDRTGRDGDRHGDPRRARDPARTAAAGRRGRGLDRGGDRGRRRGRRRGPRGRAAGERPRAPPRRSTSTSSTVRRGRSSSVRARRSSAATSASS